MHRQHAMKRPKLRQQHRIGFRRAMQQGLRTDSHIIKARMPQGRECIAYREQAQHRTCRLAAQQTAHAESRGQIKRQAESGGQHAPKQPLRRSGQHQHRQIHIVA